MHSARAVIGARRSRLVCISVPVWIRTLVPRQPGAIELTLTRHSVRDQCTSLPCSTTCVEIGVRRSDLIIGWQAPASESTAVECLSSLHKALVPRI